MPEQNNADGTETGTEGSDNGTQEQTPPQTEVKDAAYWEAEATKWQSLSRQNEKKWKDATKPATQQEPAPKDEAKPTVDPLEQYRTERVRDKARDKFETYAETLEADLNEVMKHVSIEAFIDDDSVKADEIKAYVERFAPKKAGKFAQGVGVGPQGGGNSPTIDQRIAEAQKVGDTRGVIALKREKALSNSAK